MEQLYNIGQISKISGIPIATLRYYDEIDLLKPKSVNQQTGYRYYSGDQLDRLDVIVYLKDLGFPLKKITRIMQNGRTVNSLAIMLENQIDIIDQHITELMNQRLSLKNKIQQLRKDAYEPEHDTIFERTIPERKIITITPERVSPTNNHASFGYYVHQLSNQLREGAKKYRMGSVIPWNKFDENGEVYYDQIFLDITGAPDEALLDTKCIHAGRFLCIRYQWSPENFYSCFHRLKAYVEEHGIVTDELAYEVPSITGQPMLLGDQYTLEIQLRTH